jgi:hypothetical protein
MNKQEWEIAGKAQPLSKDDVKAILEAVQHDNPTCRIVHYWNGEGCYTMSVGVDFEEGPGQMQPGSRVLGSGKMKICG